MSSAIQKKKKELKAELSTIEKQIYDLETTYLEETKEFGNIFTGWEYYLSSNKVKIKKAILNEERYFSLSSVTSPASKKEEIKRSVKIDKPPSAKKQKNSATEAVTTAEEMTLN